MQPFFSEETQKANVANPLNWREIARMVLLQGGDEQRAQMIANLRTRSQPHQ